MPSTTRSASSAAAGSDPYGLLGTVESFAELVRAGARFSGTDMHLGSVVYRVERG